MENLKKNLEILKGLGCIGIKISFEDEGALLNEVMSIRYLTACIGLDLYLKIGGGEAKRDIIDAIHLNCDGIVAPMIESKFALEKFTQAVNQVNYKQKIGFNLETISAHKNFNEIKENIKNIDFLTVGRVDFVASMNKDRSYVDSEHMTNILVEIFTETKKLNKICCLGGAISIKSKEVICQLIDKKLLDKFETRYIIFNITDVDMDKYELMLYYANLFEVEWMKYISARYENYSSKDKKRIRMIEERLSSNKLFKLNE